MRLWMVQSVEKYVIIIIVFINLTQNNITLLICPACINMYTEASQPTISVLVSYTTQPNKLRNMSLDSSYANIIIIIIR